MKKKARSLSLLIGSSLLAGTLTGCGGGHYTETTTTTTTTTTYEATESSASYDAAPSAPTYSIKLSKVSV